MTTYELTYIISPEMTSEEAGNKAKEIETAIQQNEGVILKQSAPVAKTLSYQIKKHASGFFGILEFQLEPEKLLELAEIVKKDKKIVRHMLLVKKIVKIKKQRRVRKEEAAAALEMGSAKPAQEIPEPSSAKASAGEEKNKVELKDIEKQLEDILGE